MRFLKPLQAVSGIVERRHTLPILANVLLEQRDGSLYVTATDLEMQITAHSALPGKEGQAITVGARKLQDLLRALPEDATLNIDVGNNKMTVRAGRSRFNLQTLAAADYPRISQGSEQLQSLSLPQKDLRSLFKLVEFAMAQQDIRYYLNGMLLVVDKGTLQAVATDGHRLSWASIEVRRQLRPAGSDPAAQDGAGTGQAARGQRRSGRARHPHQPGALPFRQYRAGLQGRRRQVSRFQPGHSRGSQQADRAAARRAAGGAAACRDPVEREIPRRARSCSRPISSRSSARTANRKRPRKSSKSPTKGDPLDIGFNITYLLDALSNLSVERVRFAFGDANSSALVTMPERDDYKYVVMPMRI